MTIERASRAPFGCLCLLGFPVRIFSFDPILWVAWVIRWRKVWPGFDRFMVLSYWICEICCWLPVELFMVNHDPICFSLLFLSASTLCDLIACFFQFPLLVVSRLLCKFLIYPSLLFYLVPLSIKSSFSYPPVIVLGVRYRVLASFLLVIAVLCDLFSLRISYRLISLWISYLVAMPGSIDPAIWQAALALLLLGCLFQGWPLCFLTFLVQFLLRASWVTVSLTMICFDLIMFHHPQAIVLTSLAIYWVLLGWLLFTLLHSLPSIFLFSLFIMAFSPNVRAQASTTRHVQHNWPNPFLRPAVNEPPRVVNINGLTITVDRNETHIPVPRPPPHFLNHYQNY